MTSSILKIGKFTKRRLCHFLGHLSFSSVISYHVKLRSGILTYEGKMMVEKGSVVNPNPLEISIVLTDPYPAGIQVSAVPDPSIRTG